MDITIKLERTEGEKIIGDHVLRSLNLAPNYTAEVDVTGYGQIAVVLTTKEIEAPPPAPVPVAAPPTAQSDDDIPF